jgi:hypothetical protein
MSKGESEKKEEALFVQLVLMFQAAAMQQMGKVQNPVTQSMERNLEQARFSIDILEMIQKRTKNNLSENEGKFLEHALFELRMNYVDEMNKDRQEKNQKASVAREPEEKKPQSEGSSREEDKKQEKDGESGQKKGNPEGEFTPDQSESG